MGSPRGTRLGENLEFRGCDTAFAASPTKRAEASAPVACLFRMQVQFEQVEFPLQREKEDFWAGVVKGVREGCRYRFALNSSWNDCFASEGVKLIRREKRFGFWKGVPWPTKASLRLKFFRANAGLAGDPFARFAEFDSDWCFVESEPSPLRPFQAAPWTQWILYELHCGTFAKPEKGER